MKRTRTNWTKKATILLAAICVALAGLSGFAPPAERDWLLQVEGAPISRAVYSYFLSEALKGTQGKPKDLAALRRDVAARCVEYIAVNSELRAMEVPVDQVLKDQVAQQTAFAWRVLGRYYSSIGVDKRTLNAGLAGRAAKDQLFRALYDTGGKRAVPEASIEAYFYGNFVACEGIRVLRTVMREDGEDRLMDTDEAAALRQTLAEFVEAANEAGDFYGVAREERFAKALSYAPISVVTVQKGDADYSDADFEQLRKLSPEKITLLNLPGFFLVARGVDMRESPEEYYLDYRADCLWKLKGADYEAALKELCGKYRADENAAEMERFYQEWKW
ncbi:MAG: hypothetical protein FWF60_09745 [Oscillospiraceae bacterium]|nr:hypothetical protein [Oscillospiraceae bacterium]